MTNEELKLKYGDATVLGADKSIVDLLPAKGMVNRRIDPHLGNSVGLIERNLKPCLRCEAENNPEIKQIIPYVLLRNSVTGEVYTTTRLGGDNRLKGRLSIGLGGHMDEGENIITCMLRELREEVGLTDGDIDGLMLYGYLYNDTTEVDSVHLGSVYIVNTSRQDIQCLEPDKLAGAWFSLPQLEPFRKINFLESWSAMLFDAIMFEDQVSNPINPIEEMEESE